MKKEYVTARLFKNHRAADGLITQEQLHDSDQQQSNEAQNNSQENSDSSESDADEFSLPQRLLNGIRRVLEILGFDRKD